MRVYRSVKPVLVAMAGVLIAGSANAVVHPPGTPTVLATFTQKAVKKGATTKSLYYKNEDVQKTTSVTTKVPVYSNVTEPVYTITQVPVYNSKGQIVRYKEVKTQTGTQVVNKITSYNNVVTKYTAITPKAELYTTNGSATTASATTVGFKFLGAVDGFPQLGTVQDAQFMLSATSTSAAMRFGSELLQIFETGSMSFKLPTPLYKLDQLGHHVGGPLENLLTVNFTNAVLSARAGGTALDLSGSTPNSTISFTSDFKKFTKADWQTNFDFSIAGSAASTGIGIVAVDPSLTNVTGSHSFASFRSTPVGSFGASAVPEPANWGMMLAGFGLMGGLLRRTRPNRAFA
jgi:hypothetical protein